MKIKRDTILKSSLLLAICNMIIALIFKMKGIGNAELFVIIGAVILSVFIITAQYEIYVSVFINRTQKIILTAGFVILPGIMPFIYLLSVRKNIVVVK